MGACSNGSATVPATAWSWPRKKPADSVTRTSRSARQHLLLGLFREADGIAANALMRVGIGFSEVRAEVIEIIGEGSEPPTGHIPFTPRSKKVLELSLREAPTTRPQLHRHRTHPPRPRFTKEKESPRQVLVARGADLARVRATVMTALAVYGPGPSGAQQTAPSAHGRRRDSHLRRPTSGWQLAGSGLATYYEALVRWRTQPRVRPWLPLGSIRTRWPRNSTRSGSRARPTRLPRRRRRGQWSYDFRTTASRSCSRPTHRRTDASNHTGRLRRAHTWRRPCRWIDGGSVASSADGPRGAS